MMSAIAHAWSPSSSSSSGADGGFDGDGVDGGGAAGCCAMETSKKTHAIKRCNLDSGDEDLNISIVRSLKDALPCVEPRLPGYYLVQGSQSHLPPRKMPRSPLCVETTSAPNAHSLPLHHTQNPVSSAKMIYEKMTNDDVTLMRLMNSNLVMYVPRASVLLHTGDETPKPVVDLEPPTAEQRGRNGDIAYSAYKAAEAEMYRQIGQWEKTHFEFIKYFGGLVIPVPNIVARQENIGTDNGSQRCYLVVATDCPKEARRMPLFVRSLEMCVVEDLARPITEENFFAAKDALDTIFKNPPIGKHKPESDQAKQRVYVHRLFLPCMQKKNSELVEVSKITRHIAESTKRAMHLSLDTPELPIDQISVRAPVAFFKPESRAHHSQRTLPQHSRGSEACAVAVSPSQVRQCCMSPSMQKQWQLPAAAAQKALPKAPPLPRRR